MFLCKTFTQRKTHRLAHQNRYYFILHFFTPPPSSSSPHLGVERHANYHRVCADNDWRFEQTWTDANAFWFPSITVIILIGAIVSSDFSASHCAIHFDLIFQSVCTLFCLSCAHSPTRAVIHHHSIQFNSARNLISRSLHYNCDAFPTTNQTKILANEVKKCSSSILNNSVSRTSIRSLVYMLIELIASAAELTAVMSCMLSHQFVSTLFILCEHSFNGMVFFPTQSTAF